MEEIFESLIGLAIVILAVISKNRKKARSKGAIQAHEAYKAMREAVNKEIESDDEQLHVEGMMLDQQKAAKPVEEKTVVQPQAAVLQQTKEHRHEGNPDAVCPAVERELPRIKADAAPKTDAPVIPGLNLAFDRNSVVQGVIMSEILNRPHARARR